MAIEIKVPALPESVSDATVLNWYKKPGEAVKRDENIVDLETDKVVLEVPAAEDGVLAEILQDEGATVVADDILAKIEPGAVASNDKATATAASAESAPADANASGDLSPAVRRLVAEHDIDTNKISGTGKGGRIRKQDILDYIASRGDKTPAPSNDVVTPITPAVTPVNGERPEKRVPMSRLRSRIAERLLDAKNSTAMLTTFNEVNLQAVMDIRKTYKDQFEKEHGVRLGFMSFFTKAVVEALKKFPAVNASIDGSDIVYHGYYDVGIAVSSPRGLVVPILRDVDQMSLAEIEIAIREYAQKANDAKLTIEEMTGGTFTISNGGVFGSMLSTPILNPPQSAILGMHNIQQRPMVENGEIVIRPMMYLAMSYDHRIIDGRESVSFLVTIKNLLEDPSRMVIGV